MEEIRKEFEYLMQVEDNVIRLIHDKMSAILMDYTEHRPLGCDICLEYKGAMGLSSLDMPWITKVWQHPNEGWIVFETDHGSKYDFDQLETYQLLDVLEELIEQVNQ